MTDVKRLEEIRAALAGVLAPAEIECMIAALPANDGDRKSLLLRDEAIRDARGLGVYASMARTTAAKALSRDLDEYMSNGWIRERELAELGPEASDCRRAWHRIVRFNDGSGYGLGWQQIAHVFDGHRGR